MIFELDTNIDDNDKVRHAQIKIDYFMSTSTKPAEVVEKTTKYQAQIATANMTLLINDVELSIPQGTPAAYLAELIGALS